MRIIPHTHQHDEPYKLVQWESFIHPWSYHTYALFWKRITRTRRFLRTTDLLLIFRSLATLKLIIWCSLHIGKHHSTETTLLRVTNDILRTINHCQDVVLVPGGGGYPPVLVLLDLSAAFDAIYHRILVERLQSYFGFSKQTVLVQMLPWKPFAISSYGYQKSPRLTLFKFLTNSYSIAVIKASFVSTEAA